MTGSRVFGLDTGGATPAVAASPAGAWPGGEVR